MHVHVVAMVMHICLIDYSLRFTVSFRKSQALNPALYPLHIARGLAEEMRQQPFVSKAGAVMLTKPTSGDPISPKKAV